MGTDGTILFADVCRSTRLTELVGDGRARALISGVLDELVAITRARGGRLIKTIGDEVLSLFPRADEGLRASAEMHRAVSGRRPVPDFTMKLRIGLHRGQILERDGDVFGDVVNVAARLTALAAADQVLTTHDTVEGLDAAEFRWRSLGDHGVRGRERPLQLCEFLWHTDTASLTTHAPRHSQRKPPDLMCRVGDKIVIVRSDRVDPITVGRGAECDFVLLGSSVSRTHAQISQRGGLFFIEDQSTNGTYVRPKGAEEIFVHLEKILLQGEGTIGLGKPISSTGGIEIEYLTVYSEDEP